MLNIIFWSLFISVPIFAYMQLRVAGEHINQVSLVNVSVVALFMFSVLGALPLFYFWDDYRYSTGVQDQYLVLKVLFYSSLNILTFLFGVVFVRRTLGLRPVAFSSKVIYPLNCLQKIFLITIFIFYILVLITYLKQLDKISILVALTESISTAKEYRSSMGNSFQGKYHWYKLVIHDLGSLLTFSSFALWLNRKRISTLIAFIVTFSFSVFVAIMATEKAPLAWLLIGLFMTYFLTKNDGLIPFSKLIPFSIAIVAILIVADIFFMGSGGVGSGLWSVFSRAFSGSISPAYFYLEFFPAHQNYLWGRTFPNPGGLMPYEPYLYVIEVMNWKFPSHLDSSVVGTAPTVFWGEAYANFGPLGIPIVAFIMGCIIAIVSYFFSKIEINPLSIGFMVWLILIFKDLSVTGFSGYLYNIYIAFVAIAVFLVFAARGYFRVRRNSK